jgi:hypothetical protein
MPLRLRCSARVASRRVEPSLKSELGRVVALACATERNQPVFGLGRRVERNLLSCGETSGGR